MSRPPKITPDVAVPTIPMPERADIEAPALVRALTALTSAGASISARAYMGMVGTATSGIIFGGRSATYLNDFYSYSASGGTVTLTALTRAGASISTRFRMGMVGTATSGIIFGGYDGTTRLNDFYSYSASGGTVTLTAPTLSLIHI